jgi:Cu(I)/Ag(I) efflux system membrane protein CusA/SilA
MRQGQNARAVIDGVKAKLAELKKSLPAGVIVPTYDRSGLIDRAVDNLGHKLVEEFIIVALVCALFLWHALGTGGNPDVAARDPIAFIVMRLQGLNANILSLGGIAIAIGAMVDAAVVRSRTRTSISNAGDIRMRRQNRCGNRWSLISTAAAEVGPALFLSSPDHYLLVPADLCPAGPGRSTVSPLAFTKTYAMAAAALLSITLIPVLMGLLIRGKIPARTPTRSTAGLPASTVRQSTGCSFIRSPHSPSPR